MTMQQSILPPLPSTDEMTALAEVLRFDIDAGVIGTLYDTALCPEHLLEAMYQQFEASPLYWSGNDEAVRRAIYASFHLDTDGYTDANPDGILNQKGAERALRLFSEALGLIYRYDIRVTSTGRKVGVTLYITPLGAGRDFYVTNPDAQEYLRRAYKFLLPAFLIIDAILFTDRYDLSIGITMSTDSSWGYTP